VTGPAEITIDWPPLWLDTCGSGKFGTPCERMQSENLYAALRTLPSDGEAARAPEPAPEGDDDPQPAATSAAPAITAAVASRTRHGEDEAGRGELIDMAASPVGGWSADPPVVAIHR
jgi:hypothetical protein